MIAKATFQVLTEKGVREVLNGGAKILSITQAAAQSVRYGSEEEQTIVSKFGVLCVPRYYGSKAVAAEPETSEDASDISDVIDQM